MAKYGFRATAKDTVANSFYVQYSLATGSADCGGPVLMYPVKGFGFSRSDGLPGANQNVVCRWRYCLVWVAKAKDDYVRTVLPDGITDGPSSAVCRGTCGNYSASLRPVARTWKKSLRCDIRSTSEFVE